MSTGPLTERPVVVDVAADQATPVRVEVRRGGTLVAELCVQPAPPGQPARASEGGSGPEPRPAPPRERKIFDAACEVISSKGFAATSMRDIAKAANVPIATMYRYIGSKDDLLHRITSDCMGELFDFFHANLTDGGPAASRMARAIRAYLAYISENHQYINLVYRETKALSEPARARIYDVERQFMELWANIIQDGVDDGEFAPVDVDLAANLSYFACTVWALRYWSVGDRSEAQVGDLLSKLIVDGLRSA